MDNVDDVLLSQYQLGVHALQDLLLTVSEPAIYITLAAPTMSSMVAALSEPLRWRASNCVFRKESFAVPLAYIKSQLTGNLYTTYENEPSVL